MQITEVRIVLRDEDKLRAFATVTFDGEFVVRGMKIIQGNSGLFVSMPSRKLPDGSHQDIAHPVNAELRHRLEAQVLRAYRQELERHGKAFRE